PINPGISVRLDSTSTVSY
ncbi:DEAD/DEAH box helicase family protein, partial [Chlamydia psittaci 06-1683]